MTDIEKKALEQAVAAAGRRMQDYAIMAEGNLLRQSIKAHARAIEQHEAFKREVSDAVEGYTSMVGLDPKHYFARFIIPKPDPLVEAMSEVGWTENVITAVAPKLRAALAARGLEVRKIGEGD